MFIDARQLPEETSVETAVCIIGAGAAGITVAREFIGRSFQVGALDYDEATQTLCDGENAGRPYSLIGSRMRYFGGSTNHWGGQCRPLDEIDFEERDWVPHSGWPFGRSHLDPFYERAHSICQLGAFVYDAAAYEARIDSRAAFIGRRVVTKIFRYTSTLFGQVYRDEIRRSRNITTYLFANVVEIETDESGRTATRVRVACLQGNKFWLSAKLFILATGGIENPRLLLLSNKVHRAGLGNQYDLVGRFFMEHACFKSGILALTQPTVLEALYATNQEPGDHHGVMFRRCMSLSGDTLRRHRLANYCAWLSHLGMLSDGGPAHIKGFAQYLKELKAVSLYRLVNYAEQAPNPDSRVTLGSGVDALGRNKVRLNWRMTPKDKENARRVQSVIGQEIGRVGLGRLMLELSADDDPDWSPDLWGCYHHMGTTHMHVDPRKGVVDENSRVHGLVNLFIAGSSVFPTSGFANPTLTIVALALRLADHIKRLMT